MYSILGNEPTPIDNDKSFTVPLLGVNTITFTYKDPYGLLEPSIKEGSIPEELNSVFTSPKEARNAVARYLSRVSDEELKSQPEVKIRKKAAL